MQANPRILITLGPSSLNNEVISKIDKEDIYLFRINMSHTSVDQLEEIIHEIRCHSDTPICIDTEGAQIRTQSVIDNSVMLTKDSLIKVVFEEIIGNSEIISFYPQNIGNILKVNDLISIDFNSALIKIIESKNDHCIARFEESGKIGSNKAVTIINRSIALDPLTNKDTIAIEVGKKLDIRHFALSFANASKDVRQIRKYAGKNALIISKIESRKGLINLNSIIKSSDEILIDRGDLSREIDLEKIPFMQRRIVSLSRSMKTPVYIATNLLESMVKTKIPTRAEINDVVSSLLMGSDGLVLAAETAIGKYPVESVQHIRKLIEQYLMWTPNTSIDELL